MPDWIQLQYWGPGSIEHFTVNGSIGSPAESDNLGMLAVGATHYWDTHIIADYSSQGPTPDGRVKPDIVGTACGETASYEHYYETARLVGLPAPARHRPTWPVWQPWCARSSQTTPRNRWPNT